MLQTITANWFKSGNSWALRLPRGFRLPGDSVTIRRDSGGNRLIIAPKGREWDDFFAPDAPRLAADFDPARDARPPQPRELF